MSGWVHRLVLILAGITSGTLHADSIRIAAASNFQTVMPALTEAFEETYPGTEIAVSHAASGNLVAQIRHGAPFHLFLSADLAYARALISSGEADAESLVIFAHGELVLWPKRNQTDWVTALRSPGVRRVAVANPDTAPYGTAARTALEDAGLWAELAPRLVTGENVAQTLQFVHSGNADYGLIAASLLSIVPDLGPALPIDLGPAALPHGAILLPHRDDPIAARQFIAWLGSEAAQNILRAHGYRLP